MFLQDKTLLDWNISVKATRSANELAGWVQGLINELKPDVVVSEKIDDDCRKGRKSRRLINTVTELAAHNFVLDVSVVRPRQFQTKYGEAEALAVQYPELKGRLPRKKRRFYDFEPRAMVLFEALALALEVIDGPPGLVPQTVRRKE